jgi:hypothetical protein
MPLSKISRKFLDLYKLCTSRISWVFFLGISLATLIIGGIFWITIERVEPLISPVSKLSQPKQRLFSSVQSAPAISNVATKYDEWREARDYKDLSGHDIFKKFDKWIAGYEKLKNLGDSNFYIQDPRKRYQFFALGKKLALERKKILQKIIRGDPNKAISMAMPPEFTAGFPNEIKENMESWHSEKVDLKAIHVCNHQSHPKGFHVCNDESHTQGLTKRFALLNNGKKVRVWTFGKRSKIKTVDGLAVWGISLDGDFAISENSYRQKTSDSGEKFLEFAGNHHTYSSNSERELFIDEIERAENKVSFVSRRVGYPIIAASSSLSDYHEKKYDLITTPMTWKDANNTAFARNGRLVTIESKKENDFILEKYKDAAENGFDSTGNPVTLGWIGATDSEDQNGTNFNPETNASSFVEINATEGNWTWLDGKDISETITNFDPNFQTMWLNGIEPSNANKDFGAMDWTTADGNWTDANESYRLPFVIEYDLGGEPAPNTVAAKGFRKVLVVPARFQDEGYGPNGNSSPLTDQFGNPIYPELQQDSFEPVSQSILGAVMEEVTEYYLRNSDGAFHIIPVISPTVTIPISKYATADPNGPNLFDSAGNYIGAIEQENDELSPFGGIGELGVQIAAQQSEKYDFTDHYFWGISSITLSGATVGSNFAEAPVISFVGGNQNPADNNLVHPDFEPCEARAVVNANGEITDIEILNPGAWYYSNPTVLVNGESTYSSNISATASSIAISWVTISTHTLGAAGLGYVGSAGSHVDASDGSTSWGVVAHELGHNFGLSHANRFSSRSERPNSDEGAFYEYGNPYAVMGSGSGDMTIPAKVAMTANGFGYRLGTSVGVDVASLTNQANLTTSVTNLLDENGSEHNNTFRVYRHDYGTFPASLSVKEFWVTLPGSLFESSSFDYNRTYQVKFDGSGDGAAGILTTDDTNTSKLSITAGGKGFATDPAIDVLNESNQTIFRIDPAWILVREGTSTFVQGVLRNLADSSPRGLRGLQFTLSQYSPLGTDSGENMQSMWLSYRREATEYGLSVLLGDGNTENFWIDITPNTPDDFTDAFLLPGNTFSDYSRDVHITPVAKGGMSPMEYIEVVVNMGTIAGGDAAAPELLIDVSNQFPAVGEFVEISAKVKDRNSSDFAYSWHVDEAQQTDPLILNKSTFFKSFNEVGEYVVRVIVSDMKGGVSSRNIILKVGDYQTSLTSSVSGTVRSGKGYIQGARIVASPAEVIEHTISLSGNQRDWQLPTGGNNPHNFVIDGVSSPDLVFRRGEIHRFKFDVSTDGFPLSFFDHPEHEMPRVRLKMLVTPKVDDPGNNYTVPPQIQVLDGSMFSNYLNDEIATIVEFNATSNSLMVGASNPFEVNRPYAKALLSDTNVTAVRVRPQEINEFGIYAAHGGYGHHRDNPPTVTIHRSSFWEDYSETNATGRAYVDGVGTISPRNANNGLLGNRWERRAAGDPTPEVVVWGSGSEANASVLKTTRTVNNKTVYEHTLQIHNQGIGFEPNATMAVLHYPTDPKAIWTFDLHESLYDSDTTRFYPSPGWNRNLVENLTHYWSFDEENGTTLSDQPQTGSGTPLLGALELSDLNNSHWGIKGRSIHASALNNVSNMQSETADDDGYTISVWVKPDNTDSSFTICNKQISFSSNTVPQTFEIVGGPILNRNSQSSRWAHIALTANSATDGIFYVDGQAVAFTPSSGAAIDTTNFSGLIDELRVYTKALSESQVKYLAGRSFLDLSGNKNHIVPVGSNFVMDDPATDSGSSNDRPTAELKNNNGSWPRALGDSVSGEGNGRSVIVDSNLSYLELSQHISEFEGLNEGTISFWLKPGGSGDRSIFCASNTDENQTYFQIKLRGNAGAVQLSAINKGVKVSEFYTTVNVSSGTIEWKHVALVVNQTQSVFWIDGQVAGSVATPDGPGASRAFFSDIEGLNFMAIGLHRDSNTSNSFNGNIDDFHIYDRALTNSEINFLYNLHQGRDQIPRLEALADAVGTVSITNGGAGYKELPEAEFSYGLDGNLTTDLATTAPANPNYGDLYYDNTTKEVFSRYVGYTGDGNTGGSWRNYHRAFGTPELNGTSIDQLLWTKDTFRVNILTLPNDRNVTRRYVEYIIEGDGIYPSPSYAFGAPKGLFGYTAVPNLNIEASHSENPVDDASGYVLYFLDKNRSAVIENAGYGVLDFSAGVLDLIRISGKGFRPEQIYRVETTNSTGTTSLLDVSGSSVEQWYRNNSDENKTLLYKLSEQENNSDAVATIGTTTAVNFGSNNEFVFMDWTHNAASGEPRDVNVDFNQTLAHVVVEDPGFGYSLPVSVQLIGGYPVGPELQQWYDENQTGLAGSRPLPYPFTPAVVEVNATDGNGGIVSVEVKDPGLGYFVAPSVVITGGGGNGAKALATIDVNGSILAITVTDAGRGYFNIIQNNSPQAVITHNPIIDPAAKDANVSALLGGWLSEIGLCNGCSGLPNGHTHMDPFIEIWDRNRSETFIDSQAARARAVAKVRNGKIEKVVVLDGGRGYVDPVVYVRGSPNNKDIPNIRSNYFLSANGVRQRQWRCTNTRESVDGSVVECGHIQMGLYPPERCPGETDSTFPADQETTSEAVTAWQNRHENCGTAGGYPCPDHFGVTFKSRVCSGTKANYVLINDPYRVPYENWEPWNANLVALSEGGKIKEIVVLDGGNMYGHTQIAVSGSGGGVDVITAYDDEGVNTHVIFDDPVLKNFQTDYISRPLGAGQGFMERPWAWDGSYEPTYGYQEIATTVSEGSDEFGNAFFGAPVINDNLGDRIVDVRIHDVGNFDSTSLSIDVLFNGSYRPDLNGDGNPDFVEAKLSATTTQRMVSFTLDQNATFNESGGLAGARWRSLYVEEPNVNLLLNGTNLSAETPNSSVRLNGIVDFDAIEEHGYFDLYVDDRLPETFYYGFAGDLLSGNPSMGAKITVTEGLPGMNWATSVIDSRSKTAYSDQNGYYAFSDLKPGLYNIAVFMEDENFQETTFRPESNSTHVTEVLYVPGLSDIVMESDQRGQGISRMIWTREAKALARPSNQAVNESTVEFKRLEGVGAGFQQGTTPELTIIPDPENSSSGIPKLSVEVLVDGSLALEIIDDVNTTKFNSNDRFIVSYGSSISGVDFREDYIFSLSDDDLWSGSGAAQEYGQNRLMILPNDGNGTNFVEVPLSTSLTGQQPFNFNAIAYDQNGNLLDTSGVNWQLIFDFNATEGNQSKVASITTTDGNTTDLILQSTLQRGKVTGVQVLANGINYTNGSKVRLIGTGVDFNGTLIVNQAGGITDLNISSAGTGYDANSDFIIEDVNGSGAMLKPILGGGTLTLKATLGTLETSVRVMASSRNQLSNIEKWLDLYLFTFSEKTALWWFGDGDTDSLSNQEEFENGTHPFRADSDGDGLTDYNEIGLGTNPKEVDTDQDGIYDDQEVTLGTDPLLQDTDGDGLTDYYEVNVSSSNPSTFDEFVTVSGTIFKEGEFSGQLYLRVEKGTLISGEVFYDQNESFQLEASSQFPHTYRYPHIVKNSYLRISAYVDSDSDQIFDSSEVFGEWEGQLSQNMANANILLKNHAPNVEFQDLYGNIQEVERGSVFPLAVIAYDYPNQSWTQLSVTPDAYADDNWTLSNTPALETIEVSGSSLSVLELNGTLATVDANASFGSYNLTFTAVDASGSLSVPLVRELKVVDAKDPTINILATPYLWPLGTVWNSGSLPNQAFTAVDDPPGTNLTDQVQITGEVNASSMGTYELQLSVVDESGRNSQTKLFVQVTDQTPPTILFSKDGAINYLLGVPFELPPNYFSAGDNVDGNLTSSVQVIGIQSLDINSTLSQSITIQVTDAAGNLVSENVEVIFEEPTFTLTGLAIDGYLSGSNVTFIPTATGVDQSLLLATTDQNGGFSIKFLGDVFQDVDVNNNGVLDPEEGEIVVSGGIDSTTNRQFTGQMKADAGSSVVTPLTSLVNQMIRDGQNKDDAMRNLAQSFGYSTEIDVTTYDPFAAAGTGDEDSKRILQSGALVANMMKQAEAYSEISGLNAASGQASEAVARDLSLLAAQGNSMGALLAQDSEVANIIQRAFQDIEPAVVLDQQELTLFSGIATASNIVVADSSLSNFSAGEMVSQLASRQIAVEEEVLVGLSEVNMGSSSLAGLSLSVNVTNLVEVANDLSVPGQFAPTGSPFDVYVKEEDLSDGMILVTLDVSDADGENVTATVLSGNQDIDQDGIFALHINENFEILLQDPFDFRQLLTSGSLSLTIELEDESNMKTSVQGKLSLLVKTDFSLLQGQAQTQKDWYESNWFGSFYAGTNGWIFHGKLGWLYLAENQAGGLWVWDSTQNNWWWTRENVFPYAYLYNPSQAQQGWLYFDLDSSSFRTYEFFNDSWR